MCDVQIWQKVKAANQNFTVCEIGATIGRLWREMGDMDKQQYNDDFAVDKVLQCHVSVCVSVWTETGRLCECAH